MELINARNIFFDLLYNQLETHDFYIVSADLAGPPFDRIRDDYPHRFISVGIAEQNMISVACGLALTGKKVITQSFNPFTVLRAYDQMRNAVSAMSLPIMVVGVGVGFTVYGKSHFTTEDFQLMSLCPGCKIVTVSDEVVAKAALSSYLSEAQFLYLRFERAITNTLPSIEEIDFKKGFRIVKPGSGTVVLTNGYFAHVACGTHFCSQPTVIDVFTYPYDTEALWHEIMQYDKIIVYEEQQRRGGLGSVLLEQMNERGLSKSIIRMGIDFEDRIPKYNGSKDYWLTTYSLDAENLRNAVEEVY